MFGESFFGGQRFGDSPQYLQGTGIPSDEVFGASIVEPTYLLGTGIPSDEAFGSANLRIILHGIGVVSAQAFGASALNRTPIIINLTPIGSAEAFGSNKVVRGAGRIIGTDIIQVSPIAAAIAQTTDFEGIHIAPASPFSVVVVRVPKTGTVLPVPGLEGVVR